ncbi:MAG: hypothetical protein K9K67_16030 [Bacteriovoracaceae bacterium]|nr:hypothetical protein [Bacteriovoracaceae bacterium]
MKNFFASCPRGLEELLLKESEHYNFDHVEITRGGINFKSNSLKAINFLLETRIASKIYKEVGSFEFKSDKHLLQAASELPWQKILNPTDTFKFTCVISRDANKHFRNSHYLSLVLKDSIVDTFKKSSGTRPSIDLDKPNYPFVLRIEPNNKGDQFKGIVSLDLAGYPLNQRGYRSTGHQAPIKENLAAALIMSTNWDKSTPLYDPFCGSGTFLIEAALIRYQIAPTYLKLLSRGEGERFAFEGQKWFEKETTIHASFENLCKELLVRAKNGLNNNGVAEFHGNDVDSKSIEILMEAWSNLGLPRKSLRISTVDALKWKPQVDLSQGTVITNPPYGIRLGEKDEKLEQLYYEFGENLKNNWKGFSAYLISQDSNLRKKISLKTSSRFSFYNGPLECRLLGYDLF